MKLQNLDYDAFAYKSSRICLYLYLHTAIPYRVEQWACRELSVLNCNENRMPVMRAGSPCDKYRFPYKNWAQGIPLFNYRDRGCSVFQRDCL